MKNSFNKLYCFGSNTKRYTLKIIKKLFNFSDLKVRLINLLFYCNLIPDKVFLSAKFKQEIGGNINWEDPKTFNEKLQIIKLYDRRPIYTRVADKIEFKKWISEKIGKDYVVPIFAIYNTVGEIDFKKLPEEYVIKCNHGTGANFIHTKGKKIEGDKIKKFFKVRLARNYYLKSGEWPYKNIKRRILVEPFIHGKKIEPDYKLYCFNGNPIYIRVKNSSYQYFDDLKNKENPQVFYDTDWVKMPFIHGKGYHPDFEYPKPDNLDEMLKIAAILSDGFPFVRVDLFTVDGRIFVSELTFFPKGGFGKFYPNEGWDKKLGEFLSVKELK